MINNLQSKFIFKNSLKNDKDLEELLTKIQNNSNNDINSTRDLLKFDFYKKYRNDSSKYCVLDAELNKLEDINYESCLNNRSKNSHQLCRLFNVLYNKLLDIKKKESKLHNIYNMKKEIKDDVINFLNFNVLNSCKDYTDNKENFMSLLNSLKKDISDIELKYYSKNVESFSKPDKAEKEYFSVRKNMLNNVSIIGILNRIIKNSKNLNLIKNSESFGYRNNLVKAVTYLVGIIMVDIVLFLIFFILYYFSIKMLVKKWNKIEKNVRYIMIFLLTLNFLLPYPIIVFFVYIYLLNK